ncbi:hypothetical protein [Parasphingorhabdus sp.]|uniref:hypothetical protein n=1 Tax=Parasphingorhabdus sp. TaxID=2709688 RepID=UPI003A90CF5B
MVDDLFLKELFGAAALVLTFAAFIPYMISIWRRETRPHVFSWFIWGGGTVVVCIAQLSDGAGIGAWPIGISGLLTFGVAFLALARSSDSSIVPSDWGFLLLALSALPLWFYTSTALSAVIVLTIVDLLGFGPSVRKAMDFPNEEHAGFFLIAAFRNGFVILALENYSWTTILFPAAVGGACVLFVALIGMRRYMMRSR